VNDVTQKRKDTICLIIALCVLRTFARIAWLRVVVAIRQQCQAWKPMTVKYLKPPNKGVQWMRRRRAHKRTGYGRRTTNARAVGRTAQRGKELQNE
jgi:hypothetical protein